MFSSSSPISTCVHLLSTLRFSQSSSAFVSMGMPCKPFCQGSHGLMVFCAGVMARSMNDIIMYDELFSDCPRPDSGSVQKLKGLRLGYPHQLWQDLDDDVSSLLGPALAEFALPQFVSMVLQTHIEGECCARATKVTWVWLEAELEVSFGSSPGCFLRAFEINGLNAPDHTASAVVNEMIMHGCHCFHSAPDSCSVPASPRSLHV